MLPQNKELLLSQAPTPFHARRITLSHAPRLASDCRGFTNISHFIYYYHYFCSSPSILHIVFTVSVRLMVSSSMVLTSRQVSRHSLGSCPIIIALVYFFVTLNGFYSFSPHLFFRTHPHTSLIFGFDVYFVR